MPVTAADAIPSFMLRGRGGTGRGAEEGFSCVALVFYQFRKNILYMPPVASPLCLCDQNLLT